MAYFFEDEMPSTSTFIPDIEAEHETVALSAGDGSHPSDMDQCPDDPVRTTIDQIDRKAGELVKSINISRTGHQQWMADFEEKLTEKLKDKFQQMNDILVTVYEENTKMQEVKLAELTAILNNCQRLSLELQEATQALSHLRASF